MGLMSKFSSKWVPIGATAGIAALLAVYEASRRKRKSQDAKDWEQKQRDIQDMLNKRRR